MKIMVALGGNALGDNYKEQKELVKYAANAIVDLVCEGHEVVIGHGNGPQVGMINKTFNDTMPFCECGAMSQGYIGHHLVMALQNRLKEKDIVKDVAYVLTHSLVSMDDLAFLNPSKPVGRFYTKEEMEKTGYTYTEDSGRGYRRTVPSPTPIDFMEIDTVKNLLDCGTIVVSVGGGGLPFIYDGNEFCGVDAVIDKDMSCSLLATRIKADMLLILTAVPRVCINFGKDNEESLKNISVKKAQEYMDKGEFGSGSMLPKIMAAISFAKTGGVCVITSLENAKDAMNKGTVIKI